MTKLLQWNTGRSLTPETSFLLHKTLSSTSTGIAILQEPGSLPSNWIIHKTNQAVIVTHNTIQTAPLPEFTASTLHYSAMALRVQLPNSNTVIIDRGCLSVSEMWRRQVPLPRLARKHRRQSTPSCQFIYTWRGFQHTLTQMG